MCKYMYVFCTSIFGCSHSTESVLRLNQCYISRASYQRVLSFYTESWVMKLYTQKNIQIHPIVFTHFCTPLLHASQRIWN